MFLRKRCFKKVKNGQPLPILLEDSWAIVGVSLTQYRRFYDTSWMVSISQGVGIIAITIVRDDDETKETLIKALQLCKTVEDIKALNRRNVIYYD